MFVSAIGASSVPGEAGYGCDEAKRRIGETHKGEMRQGVDEERRGSETRTR